MGEVFFFFVFFLLYSPDRYSSKLHIFVSPAMHGHHEEIMTLLAGHPNFDF